MSEYLFAYGTLQPGNPPNEIAAAVDKLQPVGTGFIRGTLYDLGNYPGAILDPFSEQEISGTIFRLSQDASVLSQLDKYEGFNPSAPDKSLFVRVLHEVVLTTGNTLQCWVYAYNREPESAPILRSGKYQKQRP